MDKETFASKAKSELLAPAGDIEAGYAALYYGADAVYLGLQRFSARATAVNFDEENLNRFVGYAHSLGRKVYVTVNTVVQEAELSDLLATLDICSRCHVDALIIQDLGVARVVKKSYPELEMHASTQMAVHNKEGALALQKLGFSRVVVARELTLPEIRNCGNSGAGNRSFYSWRIMLFIQRIVFVFLNGKRPQRKPRQMFVSLSIGICRRGW